MSAVRQALEHVFSQGGQLWLDGERVKYRAPTDVIQPLLPTLKEHKQEVAQILKLEPRGRVFRALVDNKPLTVIMPKVITLASARQTIERKFGADRVSTVELRPRR